MFHPQKRPGGDGATCYNTPSSSQERTIWILYVVPPLFLIIGLAILFEALRYRLLAYTISGTVEGFEPSRSSKGSETLRPIVGYEAGGRRYRFLEGVGSMPPGFELGERVTVLAYRALHGTARVKGKGRLIIGGAFMLLGGIGTGIALAKSSHPLAWSLSYLILAAAAIIVTYRTADTIYLESHRKWEEKYGGDAGDGVIGYVPTASAKLTSEAMRRYTYSPYWHLVGVVLGVGLLLSGAYWALDVRYFIQNSAVATGKIISTNTRTSSSVDGMTGVTLHAVIEYRPDGGTAQRYTSKLGATDPSWSVGDTVRVHYNPKRVTEAREESIWNYVFPIGMAVTGGAMMVLSIRGFRQRLYRNRQYAKGSKEAEILRA